MVRATAPTKSCAAPVGNLWFKITAAIIIAKRSDVDALFFKRKKVISIDCSTLHVGTR